MKPAGFIPQPLTDDEYETAVSVALGAIRALKQVLGGRACRYQDLDNVTGREVEGWAMHRLGIARSRNLKVPRRWSFVDALNMLGAIEAYALPLVVQSNDEGPSDKTHMLNAVYYGVREALLGITYRQTCSTNFQVRLPVKPAPMLFLHGTEARIASTFARHLVDRNVIGGAIDKRFERTFAALVELLTGLIEGKDLLGSPPHFRDECRYAFWREFHGDGLDPREVNGLELSVDALRKRVEWERQFEEILEEVSPGRLIRTGVRRKSVVGAKRVQPEAS